MFLWCVTIGASSQTRGTRLQTRGARLQTRALVCKPGHSSANQRRSSANQRRSSANQRRSSANQRRSSANQGTRLQTRCARFLSDKKRLCVVATHVLLLTPNHCHTVEPSGLLTTYESGHQILFLLSLPHYVASNFKLTGWTHDFMACGNRRRTRVRCPTPTTSAMSNR